MIVELIRDKRKIVDRISHSQIDEFVSLLQSSQVRFNYFRLMEFSIKLHKIVRMVFCIY